MPENHPFYKEEINLVDMSREEFLAIALKVVRIFEWEMESITKNKITAIREVRPGKASERISISVSGDEKAIIKSTSIENLVADWGRNQKNVEFFIDTFNENAENLTDTLLEDLKNEYKANMHEPLVPEGQPAEPLEPEAVESGEEEDEIPDANVIERKRFRSIIDIITPVDGYYITPILVMINIGIFIFMVLTGAGFLTFDYKSLISWGALSEVFIVQGEYYRLLTACFLHLGIIHLLLNMFFLVMIGSVLESAVGRYWFLAGYLLTGVGAHILSLNFSSPVTTVGASGAIFGLLGICLVMISYKAIRINPRDRLFNISIILMITDLVLSAFVDVHTISVNIKAHLWGLVTGIITGFAIHASLKPEKPEGLRYAMTLILAIVLIFTVVAKMPKETLRNRILTETGNASGATTVNTELEDKYNRMMEEINMNDHKGVELIRHLDKRNVQKVLDKLKDSGSYYWVENTSLINELLQYDWGSNRNNMLADLKDYSNLRIKAIDIWYKAIKQNRKDYAYLLTSYAHSMDSIIRHVRNVHY